MESKRFNFCALFRMPGQAKLPAAALSSICVVFMLLRHTEGTKLAKQFEVNNVVSSHAEMSAGTRHVEQEELKNVLDGQASVGTQYAEHSEVSDGLSLLGKISVRSAGYPVNYCTGKSPNNVLKSSNKAWLALLLPVVLFTFAGLAVITDKYFVKSLERIVNVFGLSDDVAGATFMAAGSSAPELFTSLLSTFVTKDDIGVGTIVGSAVFNILVIIGVSAAMARETLLLDFRPLLRDAVFYIASVVALMIFVLFSTKGQAEWWEGLIFLIGYAGYILFMKYGNKPYFEITKKYIRTREETAAIDTEAGAAGESNVQQIPENVLKNDAQLECEATYFAKFLNQDVDVTEGLPENGLNGCRIRQESVVSAPAPSSSTDSPTTIVKCHDGKIKAKDEDNMVIIDASSLPPSPNISNDAIVSEDDRETFMGIHLPGSPAGWISFPFLFIWKLVFKLTVVDCTTEKWANWWLLTFAVSIVWIMGISYVMVEAARLSGCLIGIPSSVMGLTVLAAGTSVPDALASVSVVRKGLGNMAVSNAVGSNVFDILVGLGLPWFLGGLILKKPQLITVSPVGLVVIPIGILFSTVIALVFILVLLKWKLSKTLGYILFGLYAMFLIYSLLDVYVLHIGGKQ